MTNLGKKLIKAAKEGRAMVKTDIKQPMRCLITGNPVGTDTMICGVKCDCQVCKAADEIEKLRSQRDSMVAQEVVDELKVEIERLREEMAQLKFEYDATYKGLEKRDAIIDGLRAALEFYANPYSWKTFYANPYSWKTRGHPQIDWNDKPILHDGGAIARKALTND